MAGLTQNLQAFQATARDPKLPGGSRANNDAGFPSIPSTPSIFVSCENKNDGRAEAPIWKDRSDLTDFARFAWNAWMEPVMARVFNLHPKRNAWQLPGMPGG